jgi:DNA-directed RNA polymerase specialized sigma24 family protein
MGESAEQVTQILEAVSAGDEHAAERLLPLVYEELRRLAAAKMAQQAPGQTLQATDLVHEVHSSAWSRRHETHDLRPRPFGKSTSSWANTTHPVVFRWSGRSARLRRALA